MAATTSKSFAVGEIEREMNLKDAPPRRNGVWLPACQSARLSVIARARACMMYVCMHVYFMFVCMYVCMYVCKFVCLYVGVYICMYVRMYVCMYACMYVRMY